MKKIYLIIILLLLSVTLCAQVPMALNLRFGDSETKRLTGLELQVSKWSLSGGWRPEFIPFGATTHSFDVAVTRYSRQWYESSYFISVARASEGVIYQKSINMYGITTQYGVEPSYLFQVGYRANLGDMLEIPTMTRRFSIDTGIGWNFSEHANMFAFEVILNFTIINR